ncbi:hypothetical protein [Leifsonia sp. PS1209]|uniref:hypothetical protein n=1 Tax=Leifsonia sp. PS1209 TaxID=2724914 RepID=UPI001442D86E|nr:hypothetical protein [Leifsonia sp. PS1209]QIZ99816.1 hypothetical protein HF024_15740 [Leifsonia sp. PS1209]
MSSLLRTIEAYLPTVLAAGVTTAAAWLMKKILLGILVGIGRAFGGLMHMLWNAIKWKIGWY